MTTPTLHYGEDIWQTDSQTVMVTVNTVGAMGAGIALQCKTRYPRLYIRYRKFCQEGLFQIGKLYLSKERDFNILLFPTKEHFLLDSKLEWIEKGLINLATTYEQRGITSLAMPLPGGGLGRLNENKVLEIVTRLLSGTSMRIKIYKK